MNNDKTKLLSLLPAGIFQRREYQKIEEAFDIKSRQLWKYHNYGCPEYNYKFLNHKPYCIKDSIKIKKENSHENNLLH